MKVLDLTKEAFNSKQACAVIGISRKQLIDWDAKGIVKPSIRPAMGRGSKRLYSYGDLLALRVVKGLRDLSISLQRIRKCVRYLRKHLPDTSQPLHFCTLVTDGQTIQLVEDRKTLIDTVKNPGQRAWARLSVCNLDHDLRDRVIRMSQKRIEEVVVGDEAYQVEVEHDQECGGYVAKVAGLPGCITDGQTLAEALEMAKDAIGCWEEAYRDLSRRGTRVARGKRRKKKTTA
jgi:predicted RNase H-like HicB family nuclease